MPNGDGLPPPSSHPAIVWVDEQRLQRLEAALGLRFQQFDETCAERDRETNAQVNRVQGQLITLTGAEGFGLLRNKVDLVLDAVGDFKREAGVIRTEFKTEQTRTNRMLELLCAKLEIEVPS